MNPSPHSTASEIDCFRTIHCMNLRSRADRWADTEREVVKLGDAYTLVRCEALENQRQPHLGHTQTFASIVQAAKERKMPAVLIGEDDMVLCDKSAEAWESALAELPGDWDILSGGVYQVRDREWVSAHLCRVSDFSACHFILLRDTVFDRVLQFAALAARNSRAYRTIDRYLGGLTGDGEIHTYLVWPMVSSQRAGYSDLRHRSVDDNLRNRDKGLEFLTLDHAGKNPAS